MGRKFGLLLMVVGVLLAYRVATRTRARDLDCDNFGSQASAQAYLRLHPDDPDGLDPDSDGVACPENPAPFDRTPVQRTGATATTVAGSTATTAATTATTLSTAATPMADTGPFEIALLGIVGTVLLISGTRLRGYRPPGRHWA